MGLNKRYWLAILQKVNKLKHNRVTKKASFYNVLCYNFIQAMFFNEIYVQMTS